MVMMMTTISMGKEKEIPIDNDRHYGAYGNDSGELEYVPREGPHYNSGSPDDFRDEYEELRAAKEALGIEPDEMPHCGANLLDLGKRQVVKGKPVDSRVIEDYSEMPDIPYGGDPTPQREWARKHGK